MITASLFPSHVATAIRRNGAHWLAGHADRVQSWADDFGIQPDQLRAAIAIDLGHHEPTPPATPYRVDVIVPFCAGDSQYLAECLGGIYSQQHVRPTIHVIRDGGQWPALPDAPPHCAVHRYETTGGIGPYRATNALIAAGHCTHEWLALQDADDISYPDRLWRQVQTLQTKPADMIGSAMKNVSNGYNARNLGSTTRPGAVFGSCPHGRTINGTRTMRRRLFVQLNGFADAQCTMDFDLDNRAAISGARIVFDQTILADRRMHPDSLTCGGDYAAGTPNRKATIAMVHSNLAKMKESPTLETIQKLGALNKAPALRVLQ